MSPGLIHHHFNCRFTDEIQVLICAKALVPLAGLFVFIKTCRQVFSHRNYDCVI